MSGLENKVEDIFPKEKRKKLRIQVLEFQSRELNIQIRMISERKNWENCKEEIIQENLAELEGTHFQMETANCVLELCIQKRPKSRHIMKFQYNGDKNKNFKIFQNENTTGYI